MSWFKPAFLIFSLLLASCGFEPVYGTGSAVTGLLGGVRVQEQTDLDGFLVVQRLEERLGRPVDPQYDLTLKLTTTEAGLAVDPEGNIERFQVIGWLDYQLMSIADGSVMASGGVNDFTGYSASGSTVATLASKRAARARLMTILADELIVKLQTADLHS